MRRGRPCGKLYGGPWYGHSRRRLLFEYSARKAFALLRRNYVRRGPLAGLQYRMRMPVPGYEDREVTFTFLRHSTEPLVFADGPTESPHRYSDNSLCMWHPQDPSDSRWMLDDGLLQLAGMTARHLLFEAYWRETDEWPGEEAPHEPSRPRASRRTRRAAPCR